MDLYHPKILKHNNEPVHFQKLEDADAIVEAYNPVCGDQFDIYIKWKGDIIVEVSFKGFGCAVSKASTSMLIERLQSLNTSEAKILLADFLSKMSTNPLNKSDKKNKNADSADDESLNVLLVAKKYGSRVKCATLGWTAMTDYFNDRT